MPSKSESKGHDLLKAEGVAEKETLPCDNYMQEKDYANAYAAEDTTSGTRPEAIVNQELHE